MHKPGCERGYGYALAVYADASTSANAIDLLGLQFYTFEKNCATSHLIFMVDAAPPYPNTNTAPSLQQLS